jgi:AraC family transcriptional activator of mtrCDE
MNGAVSSRVKLQFRQYRIDPDFPIFAFMKGNQPHSQIMELNAGDRIKYMHFHNCIEMAYCFSGSGKLYVEDESFEYGAGDVMLVLPYNAHITHTSDDDNYVEYLYFDPSALLRKFYPDGLPCISLFESSASNPCNVISGNAQPHIAHRMIEILDELRQKRLNYQDCVKGLVLALMMELARLISEQQPRPRHDGSISSIFPAIKFINDNYTERISAECLHEKCYLSATHFRRLFGAVMGCSPLEYIHRLRINRACDLLLSTNDSILDISLAVGFDSVSSFNRQFIQATGLPPSKWRKERMQARSELMPADPYDVVRRESGN